MMAVSFAQDIRPLFTDMDIAHMGDLGVPLDDLGYMRDPGHAQQVLDAVSTGVMPPRRSGEPPWSPESVQLFRDWIAGGYQS
jgi:hypothetical protein